MIPSLARRALPLATSVVIGGGTAFLVGAARHGGEVVGPAGGEGLESVPFTKGAARATAAQETRETFQKAWMRLMSRDMADEEKKEVGSLLLKKWAVLDPEGALAAALEADRNALPGKLKDFLHALDDAIQENPELFFSLISSDSLGLDRALVRNVWIAATAKSCPDVLTAHLEDLPAKSRAQAVAMALETLGKDADPTRKDALLDSLAKLPDSSDNRAIWDKAGATLAHMGAGELKDRILSSTTPGEKAMAVKGFGMALTSTSRDEAKQTLGALPSSLQSEIVAKAIQYDGGNSGALMSTIDVLLASEQWPAASKRAVTRIHNLGLKAQDPIEMANWAMELPERADTEEIFQSALRGYFYRSPADAKEWIQSIRSTWKRDNALMEYTRLRLVSGGDRDAAGWAISQIADPATRAAAAKVQADWEAKQ